MDNVVYDEDSIMGKNFVGLDNVVDMKQAGVMKSSNIVGNFEELFGVLPDLTMSSIGSAKNKAKGFDLEFGALVGCPDKSMKHEINKPRNFRRINQRVKALKNWKWDEVIEIDSFGEDS
ncbi:hypothetical protein HanPSC8_Chr14g0618381 [Helianthus annuus]|nr:hypothetical protein HanPSC8_Chr14g0618381 [Helianthus annuus]